MEHPRVGLPEAELPRIFYECGLVDAYMKPRGPIYKFTGCGYGSCDDVADTVQKMPGSRLIGNDRIVTESQVCDVWAIPDGVLLVRYGPDEGHVYAVASGFDRAAAETIIEAISSQLKLRPPSSRAMVVVNTMRGMELHSIGTIDTPLVRLNYSSGTLADYDHIVSCLSSRNPCGRLGLLTGPPGTGKSYLIRAIATEVEALFVLIPASLAGSLSGPEIMPVLIQNKVKGTPIVLVIEDADTCLSKDARSANPDGLADILNLGDGLFGQLIDVRVIATSNSERIDLDPAITRPGRMCRHLSAASLERSEATAAFEAIAERLPKKPFLCGATLAEIYRLARLDGWEPDRSEPYRAGDYR